MIRPPRLLGACALAILLTACSAARTSPGNAGKSAAAWTSSEVSRTVPASDSRFLYEGRFDFSDTNAPVVIWQASRIRIDFDGDAIRLLFGDVKDQNFFNAEVDGSNTIVEVCEGRPVSPPSLSGFGPGRHHLVLFKRSEATAGTVRFRGVELAPGATAWAPPPPSYRLRMEFIGDSITVGACNEDGPEDQWKNRRTHNSALSYAALTAAAFNADCRNISVSGMGVATGWVPMRAGEIWDRLYPNTNSPRADLTKWTPQDVFVNLGENDDSYTRTHGQPFPAEFADRYVALVRAIRAGYPDARIVLLRGGMFGGAQSEPLRLAWESAVAQLEATDPHVSHFVFRHWTRNHPRVADDRIMADELIAWLNAHAFGQLGRGDRYAGTSWATRSPVLAQHGMVATEQPLASQIAIDILKRGGSAVDAAIAANAAIGLMQPVLNGIGGDLFAIVYDPKTKRLYGYNGSGRSPKGCDLTRLKLEIEATYQKAGEPCRAHIPPYGSLSVTVPGAVDAWFALHDRFGKLPMKEDLQPAIDYARNGFPVTQLIALYWQKNMAAFEKNRGLIEEFDNARATYLIHGHTPAEGEIFRNADLAQTLTILARKGRDAFYKGEIAHRMAAYFARIGGDLRYDDFAGHHGEWVEPLSVNYRGYDVYELPPNGQGGAALEMLQILKGYDLKKMGAGSADALTAMLEAKRLAFEDLARWYADPAFVNVPMKGLISEVYANERRKRINLAHANPDIGPGNPNLTDGDTIYLTTADKDGMMVSLIQSNYRGMGSGLVADHLGFMFQDRGELFSLEPKAANVYAPGKRPFHTIIPAFVMKDGQPFMSFGVMGGDMQPQGHVQILTDIIDFGMNVQEAGDAARWRHYGNAEPTGEASQGIGTVEMESGFDPQVKAELEKRGYKVVPGTGAFGGYQAIQFDPTNHVYWGASEMRKDGEAIGY